MKERIDKRIDRILKQPPGLGTPGAGAAPLVDPGLTPDVETVVPLEPKMWLIYPTIGIDLPPSIDTDEEAYKYVMEVLGLNEAIESLPGYVRHGEDKQATDPFG
jgi:hypothetical protein